MVENENCKVNINDSGVLSKESEKSGDWSEVTDYWDISGVMDATPGGSNETRGNMKLQETADGRTTIEGHDAPDGQQQPNVTISNDNVIMTADEGDAIKQLYCDNGKSAINYDVTNTEMDINKNSNNNNNNGGIVVTPKEGCDSKDDSICKNSTLFVENIENNKEKGNSIAHQTQSNTVGTDETINKEPECDVSDTLPNNSNISGAKDNCTDGDNKTPLTIREEMLLDSECTEERFRIDRKKLEQMLQAATEGRGQSGEDFFQNIMDDTKTYITWPSKLKIGAKSKKDPHIRICGRPDNIKEARQRIMMSLDTKSNRVTIKMDVSHTEHSHVIGKGGNNIKRVMQETGCHIHFPDSNRNNAGEKSNQVSITGHPEGVENARLKIRNLLPIVLQFEIPNAGLPMPDLNSPMIQHLVQVYGISIQFKQRAKVYSTSCTIRGSTDNIEGLKSGIQTLMNHVAGANLAVTNQIEIAPQHHAYMLSKTGLNVTSIMQSTGARIIFPDPTALPKKSTVYISGSIDSVVLARHKLMGCLPMLLMFDMKADINNPNSDTSTIAHLMETLDVSINIKSKPKQPSRTVIIKSVECNIYNMFESRAKLLGLESNGIKRPAQSMSPKLTRSASIAPSPVILLAHSHVPTPTAQTHVIGLTEQKSVAPLVLGGPSYVLAHNVPSNPATPRPLSATLAAVHTPSHSPYPTLPTPNGNIQSLRPGQVVAKTTIGQDEINNGRYQVLSPPAQIQPMTQAPTLRQDNIGNYPVVTSEEMQRRINQRLNMVANDNMQVNSDPHNYYMYNQGSMNQADVPRRSSQNDDYDTVMQQKLLFSNNCIPTSANSYENSRALLSQPTYDPNSGDYQRNIQSISNIASLLQKPNEGQQNRQMQDKMNEHFLRQTGHYRENSLPDDNLLGHRFGAGSVEVQNQDIRQMRAHTSLSSNNSGSSNSLRQSVVGVRSPDSIGDSRTSERISPMSSVSDRFNNGNSNAILGVYDQFDDQSIRRTPSPSNSTSSFQQRQDINSISPMNHHRSPPQIVLNQNSQYEASHFADRSDNIGDLYSQQRHDVGNITTGPPPGFEHLPPTGQAPHNKTDYENVYKLAKKAMENKPVTSEVRTPTDVWAGYGFSKTMPFKMKEELKKIAASKGRFKNNLPTTYEIENGEISLRNQPSPVNEEEEYNMADHSPSRLHVPTIGKGSSSLNQWRRRRLINMNLSLGGNMGMNYMSSPQRPPPQKHSAFTPIHPNESLNRSSASPKVNPVNVPEAINQTRPVMNSPFSNSGNEQTLQLPLPEKPKTYDSRINMSSTPTIQDSLGLNAAAGVNNKVEANISDVLTRLDLTKYISVFQQQEVDFQTFLTLTESDLKELGISIFGPRKKILLAIKDLNEDRDVFSGPATNQVVHENLSDQMLQLQRLQLQQHRDNPQTTSSNRLDSHRLLSPSRQLFSSASQQSQLDPPAIDNGVFHEDSTRGNDRMRSANSSRLWRNPRTEVSNSGRW